MAPGAWSEEGLGAIKKHPGIQKHDIDTWLSSTPSLIWRFITPVSTLLSSTPIPLWGTLTPSTSYALIIHENQATNCSIYVTVLGCLRG